MEEVEATPASWDGAILSTGLVGIETKRETPWWAYCYSSCYCYKKKKKLLMLMLLLLLPPSRKIERDCWIPTCSFKAFFFEAYLYVSV